MINESLISLSEMNNQIIFQSVGLLLTFNTQYIDFHSINIKIEEKNILFPYIFV